MLMPLTNNYSRFDKEVEEKNISVNHKHSTVNAKWIMLNKHDERVLFQKAKSKRNMTEMEQNTFSSSREQHLVKKK